MALKKKSLKQTATENTTVTKGTSKNQETLKSGTPNDHHRKQQSVGVVGVNLGITKNMDNYESLRVDCWLTDEVQPGETQQQAFERIIGVVDEVLQDTVQSYIE
jgi:hypothetical protein